MKFRSIFQGQRVATSEWELEVVDFGAEEETSMALSDSAGLQTIDGTSDHHLFRIPYRKFLNTAVCHKISLDPVLRQLQEKGILDESEVDAVNGERTTLLKRHCLFSYILPQKGLQGFETLEKILREQGKAADELCYCVPPELLHHFDPTMRWKMQECRAFPVSCVNPLLACKSVTSLFHCLSPHGTEEDGQWAYGDQAAAAATVDGSKKGSTDPNRAPISDQKERRQVRQRKLAPEDVTEGDRIGRGGFAEVYVGTCHKEKVAIKKFIDFAEFAASTFLSEVEIMSTLNHPNVVGFVGFVYEPEKPYLWVVMEYVAGPMRRFCTYRNGQTPPPYRLGHEEKLFVTAECWRGLTYLHGRNLCHKDIDPDNILIEVSKDGKVQKVKIGDFGLSEFKEAMVTMRTGGAGTYMYYPPELVRRKGQVRHAAKSDVYSMAASLCELFSEQFLWNDNGTPRSMQSVTCELLSQCEVFRNGTITYPDCWPAIPPPVQGLLADAITPDYRNRKTAPEMLSLTMDLIEPEIHVLSHGTRPFLSQIPLK